ncbi:hypothetical protein ABMA10_09195 [Plantibacter sp. RU18]
MTRLFGDWHLSGAAPDPWARRHAALPVPSRSTEPVASCHKTSPAELIGNLS